MKICRFNHDRLGLVLGNEVADVTTALEGIPAQRWPLPQGDVLIRHWPEIASRIDGLLKTAVRHGLDDVSLQSPITNPSKVIGIARNRRGLANEKLDLGGTSGNQRQDADPIQMFIKAPSAIAGPADGVHLRFPERRTDPEAELTIIIGRSGTQIAEADAIDHVFGYCIGLDMTLRGKESPSSRKSIDTFAVLGPWIVTRDEMADPDSVGTKFELNGHVTQQSNTRDLAFNIRQIIAHASQFYTLHPGDAIMVGTPVGFEPVKPGDVMVATFEGIGRMEVAVHGYV
jgi:2-keto-4-pentenoate hydratase/2-oxohepta-3-ene-1,7-dioic acid hydratase in catechol pathway